MNTFITGSWAYGEPTADSDIDVVMLVSHIDYERLQIMADRVPDVRYADAPALVLRFGKMNLLLTTCPVSFAVWIKGTELLKAERKKRGIPVNRERAMEVFRALRKEHGVAVGSK